MTDYNPPAFLDAFIKEGMELRDYFAGQALPLIASTKSTDPSPKSEHDIAEMAYALADAMLEARAKPKVKYEVEDIGGAKE